MAKVNMLADLQRLILGGCSTRAVKVNVPTSLQRLILGWLLNQGMVRESGLTCRDTF